MGGSVERSQQRASLPTGDITASMRSKLRELNDLAQARGQSLAQMAISWVLNNPVVTSALIGASSTDQLDENLGALEAPAFSAEELAEIDRISEGGDANAWA